MASTSGVGTVRRGIGLAGLLGIGVFAAVAFTPVLPTEASPAMYPALGGDETRHFLRWRPSPAAPERGAMVVFYHPQHPGRTIVQRVVGVEGDRVWVREDGSVEVNGQPLRRCEVGPWRAQVPATAAPPSDPLYRSFLESNGEHRYLTIQAGDPSYRDAHMPEYCVREPCKVPDGSVFVMGDNRDNSDDSRSWAFVPRSHLVTSLRDGGNIGGVARLPDELRPGLAHCERSSALR